MWLLCVVLYALQGFFAINWTLDTREYFKALLGTTEARSDATVHLILGSGHEKTPNS